MEPGGRGRAREQRLPRQRSESAGQMRFCSGLTCFPRSCEDRANKEKTDGEDVQASFSRRDGRLRDGGGLARSGSESFEHHGDFVRRSLGDLDPGGGRSGVRETNEHQGERAAGRAAAVDGSDRSEPREAADRHPRQRAGPCSRRGPQRARGEGLGAARAQSRRRAPQLHRHRRRLRLGLHLWLLGAVLPRAGEEPAQVAGGIHRRHREGKVAGGAARACWASRKPRMS